MASVNKVILVGNCGRDPEIRYLPSGQAVANISVATSSRRKDRNSGETIEDTQWHRVTFYDRLGRDRRRVRQEGHARSTWKAA
jgi:single-strand DNA-binding protein